jgi:hypothetical protein
LKAIIEGAAATLSLWLSLLYLLWCPHIEAGHFSSRIYSDIAYIIF